MRQVLCVLLALLTSAAIPAIAADEPRRPNILFILADDLGWADVGFHGAKFPTPHIDSLAQRGAELTQHYVQPVCTPTRAAFLTGRYPIRYGLQVGVIRPWADYGLPLNEQTLAQALKTAGYTTAICGKWHLGHIGWEYLPTRRGFDRQYGHMNGAIDYFKLERDGGHDWRRDDKPVREEGYSTFLLADEAIRIIRGQPADKPLFLYLPFNAPHSPLQAPQEYLDKAAALGHKAKRQKYVAMVMAMDDAIGRVVEAIDQTGRRDNTLIVFASDNGGVEQFAGDNGPLRGGKFTLYEGGVRSTTLAAWPGVIEPGAKIDAAMHIVDWYPTLTKLTGAKTSPAGPLDGRDIWPVLTEGAPSPHEDILHNLIPEVGAIRVGDWKLVARLAPAPAPGDRPRGDPAANSAPPADDPFHLFNIAADPYEKNNLARQHPEKVKQLMARLEAYRQAAVPPAGLDSQPMPEDYKAPAVWGPTD